MRVNVPAVRAVIAGLIITAAGTIPPVLAGQANRTLRPDLPWALLATVAYLLMLIAWLHGWGPPRRSSEARRSRLRLWPPSPAPDAGESPLAASGIVGLLAMLTVVWIGISRLSPLPDLSLYPTTSYRWSMFLIGGTVSGVVEEAAFRGYLQTGLERVTPAHAIVITSLVFTLSHVTKGLDAVLLLGPGIFAASVLYGYLAQRTGTILPGMIIHVAGDLARTFFGVLRGDVGLLFV